MYGGVVDELLRSCLGLMAAYMSKTCPTLTYALERAQKASLPSEVLDELMAAAAKIGADCISTVRCIGDLDAAGGNRVQIMRRSIAGVEHMNDEARTLTKRIDRLLEPHQRLPRFASRRNSRMLRRRSTASARR
jgi:hypothetical protein